MDKVGNGGRDDLLKGVSNQGMRVPASLIVRRVRRVRKVSKAWAAE